MHSYALCKASKCWSSCKESQEITANFYPSNLRSGRSWHFGCLCPSGFSPQQWIQPLVFSTNPGWSSGFWKLSYFGSPSASRFKMTTVWWQHGVTNVLETPKTTLLVTRIPWLSQDYPHKITIKISISAPLRNSHGSCNSHLLSWPMATPRALAAEWSKPVMCLILLGFNGCMVKNGWWVLVDYYSRWIIAANGWLMIAEAFPPLQKDNLATNGYQWFDCVLAWLCFFLNSVQLKDKLAK